MHRLAAAAVLLLAACTVPDGGPLSARRAPVLTDGRTADTPAPLVVVLHGFTGTGRGMQRKTRFDDIARRDGILVAYPSGLRRRWDDRADSAADVEYLATLIEGLIAEGRADASRIYVAGHSNGGAMAMRFACARPDLVRAIGVVSMNAPDRPACSRPPATAAMFIHGTQDPIVPPDGLPPAGGRGGIKPVAATLRDWSTQNGCDHASDVQVFDRSAGPATARYVHYVGCAAPLTHITLSHHGHEWPGAGPRARLVQGPATNELDAAWTLWQFFSSW